MCYGYFYHKIKLILLILLETSCKTKSQLDRFANIPLLYINDDEASQF